ncbi:hypothetical protein [Paracraurococcus ruber]|uniref:Sensor domain-containing protein n=1 Tax=Paracraurococcus ruber TaxID=77675 RepID=A0ABS1CYQ0_9PROT|nr:hypothetical protein [Paracraurococcus ruber]MBK1659654.1 hypothetical protein [Paracraurococcus ruber]TDG30671.1 hypothetical protein E2C05_13580 [Paracraurococcus ruber]
MRLSDRFYLINQKFDRLPLQQQFLAAFWSAQGGLLVLLMLCFFAGFPFLFTSIVVFILVMGPRLMFKFDMLDISPGLPPRDAGGPTAIAVRGPAWAYGLNAWFDAKAEHARILIVAFATLGIFVLNLALHALFGLPVGLLVMLALLVLGWARVLHVNGWLAPQHG